MDPRAVAGLASKRTYPLHSSFAPSYNMAVNLTDRLGRSAARALLEQSFAQFQADAAVVGLARQVARNDEAIAAYERTMQCHLGDITEYLDLLNALSSAEKEVARAGAARKREATVRDLTVLKRGDVIAVPTGRRAGLAVILDPGVATDGTARPLVVTAGRWAGRLTSADFRGPVPSLGRIRLGKHTDHRSPQTRRDIASALASSGISAPARGARTASTDDAEIAVLRRAVRAHPVHGCADRDQHLQWARRRERLVNENRGLAARVDAARGSLGREFERILALLTDRGYLRGDRVTPAGAVLARIWSESDLVVAECLRRRLWDPLTAADLAATVSVLVFESRRDLGPTRTPAGPAAGAIKQTVAVWSEITAQEREHGLPSTRDPDHGFAGAVASWARGNSLSEALTVAAAGGTEVSAGDFVRWCRQVIDLLDQIRGVADEPVRATAAEAVRALRRGVVALGVG